MGMVGKGWNPFLFVQKGMGGTVYGSPVGGGLPKLQSLGGIHGIPMSWVAVSLGRCNRRGSRFSFFCTDCS